MHCPSPGLHFSSGEEASHVVLMVILHQLLGTETEPWCLDLPPSPFSRWTLSLLSEDRFVGGSSCKHSSTEQMACKWVLISLESTLSFTSAVALCFWFCPFLWKWNLCNIKWVVWSIPLGCIYCIHNIAQSPPLFTFKHFYHPEENPRGIK
jgi:hypothetical protein